MARSASAGPAASAAGAAGATCATTSTASPASSAAAREPGAATSAQRFSRCWTSSRCTATRSCASWASAAGASGARARAPSTRRSSSSRTRSSSAPRPATAGRRVFALTDAGREAQKAAAGGPAPWEEVGVEGDVTALELRDLVGQVVNAARQVLHAGEAAQIAQAKDVLRDTRRKLYRILAEDSPETPADEAGDSK